MIQFSNLFHIDDTNCIKSLIMLLRHNQMRITRDFKISNIKTLRPGTILYQNTRYDVLNSPPVFGIGLSISSGGFRGFRLLVIKNEIRF